MTFPPGRITRPVCVCAAAGVHEVNQLDRQPQTHRSENPPLGSEARWLPEAANNPECWRCAEPEAAAVTD